MSDMISRTDALRVLDMAIDNKLRLVELALAAGTERMAERYRCEIITLREVRARIEAMA